MLSQVKTIGLNGINGFDVVVEADIGIGMPHFNIIGLPGQEVKEAQDRTKSAIRNSKFDFPGRRITINLSPASTKKEGSHYDLAIAISILAASGQVDTNKLGEYIFIGEISLDGSIHAVNGILAMVISGFKNGITKFIIPKDNAFEAGVVEGATIYPASNLLEVTRLINGVQCIEPYKTDLTNLFSKDFDKLFDMSEVKGQDAAKRALEIAAAGGHNVLMVGPAGTGKSMMAKRLGGILPDLTFDEALEVTKIHSIAGILPKEFPFITKRPFRAPHHTVSAAALSGGGSVPKPGELSLAHLGVLFLDEALEFSRSALETLRQPLEDGQVTVSRVNATYTYPCNITLVCAMNPCKCGNYGNPRAKCTCTPVQVANYRSRMSGPLLDRMDIQIEVPSIKYEDLASDTPSESSAEIKKRVMKARGIQEKRFKDYPGIYTNSQMTPKMLEEYCRLGDDESEMLRKMYDKLGLSARAHSKILKIARTIADLDGSENIELKYLSEAIGLRNLDRTN